jgi:putative membrane protein
VNLNRTGIVIFCAAMVVVPSLLFGQMGTMQDQAPQSSRPPNKSSGTPDTGMGPSMPAENGIGGTNEQTMRDQTFVRNAAEGGLAEVQLGQLAAQKGSSEDVKSFGQRMVQDHTTLNENMKLVAESMNLRVPTKLNKKDQAEYDRLNGLSGSDFDNAYLTDMVKDHHKDLQDFRMEDAVTTNQALKAVVQKGGQVIQGHTQMVDQLAKAKGLPVPASKR